VATWLVKTEPGEFSFEDLVRKGVSRWDGVSNPQALIHLRAMKDGDAVLVYHTGDERAIVGLAKVERAAYEDPARPGKNERGEAKFAVVDLRAVAAAREPVALARIKSDERFGEFALVRQGRLSVMPVPAELAAVLRSWAGLGKARG
jgi:predicted RNA-binding protein with PUA-like domain